MATDDFFRTRLDPMIDLKHPLAVLATGLRSGYNSAHAEEGGRGSGQSRREA